MADSIAHGRAARLGGVSISIDADAEAGFHSEARSGVHGGKATTQSSSRNTAFQRVLVELIDCFNRHRLPATWALANPSTDPMAARIIASGAGHEIAILPDTAFSRSDCSRADFVRAAIQPLTQAAAAGVAISTVAVAGPWHQTHVDLLTKHGIKIIRSSRLIHASRSSGATSITIRHISDGIQTVCYGLWHVPVSVTLHGGGWMANHAQLRLARRSIQAVAQCGGMCHVRIDAAALARGDAAIGLRHIDRLLSDLQQLRAGSYVAVNTLGEIPQRMQPKRTMAAARSILRAA